MTLVVIHYSNILSHLKCIWRSEGEDELTCQQIQKDKKTTVDSNSKVLLWHTYICVCVFHYNTLYSEQHEHGVLIHIRRDLVQQVSHVDQRLAPQATAVQGKYIFLFMVSLIPE